jgi:hypothetical protein
MVKRMNRRPLEVRLTLRYHFDDAIKTDYIVLMVVKAIWTIKAEELKQESYGVELLHTVGFVYSSKSK